MNSFQTTVQPIADQAQAVALRLVETTRKNINDNLDLGARAAAIRSPEDAQSFFEAAAKVARDGYERMLLVGQQNFQETAALAKGSADAIRAQFGNGLPNMETLMDPKTYGFAGQAEAAQAAPAASKGAKSR